MRRSVLAAVATTAFMLATSANAAEVTALVTLALKSTLTENYTVFAGAVVANAKQPAAGKALLDFLAAANTVSVMKAKGLEPAS